VQAAYEEFFQRMRRRDFDLAVQLHGGGRYSNPFLNRLGAAHTVGMRTPDTALVERWMPYSYYQHEVLRALEVVGLAGAAPVALEPRLDAGAADRDRALRLVDQQAQALLVIHPGASDLRRRWPAERFAEVAARVVAADAQVILVGDDSDRPVAEDSVRRVRLAVPAEQAARVSSVAGQLTLPQLIGLFAVASAMLGNDSGPRHLAQAVGTPTIGVYWVGNLINAGPLGRGQHRVQLSWTRACPVCDRDCTQVGWTSERCEHEVSFVTDVRVDAVFEDVAEQLALRVARSETA
jgi:ADP-heptose:LPS heptosyltransferase